MSQIKYDKKDNPSQLGLAKTTSPN